MPFMKLPPEKNPRFAVVPAVEEELDLVVEDWLTPLSDLEGVFENDFLPELNERGLASTLAIGTVTAIVNANRLKINNAFFHM